RLSILRAPSAPGSSLRKTQVCHRTSLSLSLKLVHHGSAQEVPEICHRQVCDHDIQDAVPQRRWEHHHIRDSANQEKGTHNDGHHEMIARSESDSYIRTE